MNESTTANDKVDPQTQIGALRNRYMQAYILMPLRHEVHAHKPPQAKRLVYAYPTRRSVTKICSTCHGVKAAREETHHYRDVFIPGVGNLTVRADRLRIDK